MSMTLNKFLFKEILQLMKFGRVSDFKSEGEYPYFPDKRGPYKITLTVTFTKRMKVE